MNVASLELCKELYELSQWDDTFAAYYLTDCARSLRPAIKVGDDWPGHQLILESPAYDLGYLLRKLPRHLTIKRDVYLLCILNGNANDDNWIADYVTWGRHCWLHEKERAKLTEAGTAENAACKLAIELFKQGILKSVSRSTNV